MVLRRRLDLSGPALVFITTGIQNAVPILAVETVADTVIRQLRDTVSRERLSIVGYVVMPNHVHLLLGFPDIKRLSVTVRDFKRLSARQVREILRPEHVAKLQYKGMYKLWQRRFDDVIIFSKEQFITKLNYIHRNPVKAGLVANESDYRYSSASDWVSGKSGSLPIDKDWSWVESAGT